MSIIGAPSARFNFQVYYKCTITDEPVVIRSSWKYF